MNVTAETESVAPEEGKTPGPERGSGFGSCSAVLDLGMEAGVSRNHQENEGMAETPEVEDWTVDQEITLGETLNDFVVIIVITQCEDCSSKPGMTNRKSIHFKYT